jgi:hypothetical protein
MEGKTKKNISNVVLKINLIYRYTLNNIDLNRNFPDYLGAKLSFSMRAFETSAIMSWIDSIPFILSANYHGGAFIINTPYDRYCNNYINFKSNKNVFFSS